VNGQSGSTNSLYAAANFTLPTNVDTLFLEGNATRAPAIAMPSFGFAPSFDAFASKPATVNLAIESEPPGAATSRCRPPVTSTSATRSTATPRNP
jgi:hypothetical protein